MMEKLLNKITQGDCLELMKELPDKSIDMILCDLPYGTTACKWDVIIPFEQLWQQYERIIKDNGAIVLFSSQPFTSALIMSKPELFKYCWVWDKGSAANFVLAKRQPLKYHEDICVFYKKQSIYNPIKWQGKPNHKQGKSKNNKVGFLTNSNTLCRSEDDLSGMKLPRSIIDIPKHSSQCKLHPTQKPVVLCEYLIKTYTNEGDIVLDNCMGSGTTAVAAINTIRNFIGFEKEQEYVDIANKRLEEHQLKLFV